MGRNAVKDSRNVSQILSEWDESGPSLSEERKTLSLPERAFSRDEPVGKDGAKLLRSKFSLGQLMKFNQPGNRRVYRVTRIETYDNGSTYKYDVRATSGGMRGSHGSSVDQNDLVPADEKIKVSEPKWMPRKGETVKISNMNFDTTDTVIDVKKERGRWNIYLKQTAPDSPGRKPSAHWDGKYWTSNSGRFHVEPYKKGVTNIRDFSD